MQWEIQRDRHFEFVEAGQNDKPTLLLLHGLFGALSNWQDVILTFSPNYRVIIPLLPIYKASEVQPSVEGLAGYVLDFIQYKGLKEYSVIGNSLGGQIGLLVVLANPKAVHTLTLTGSSGLFESGMGSTFPRRGDYSYVKERVEFTFYNPETADKLLIDEVYDIVNDSHKAIRIIKVARAAQRLNMRADIQKISIPTCLIWGLNDTITPTYVAHEFRRLIPASRLHFIDRCGHAPMMEQPQRFNYLLQRFLNAYYEPVNVS
jgi:pimeloyl-ACP methyl ester carboxylesterase